MSCATTASASSAVSAWASSSGRACMPRAEVESARTISSATRVAGELAVPGDKSIAHRALMLAALAQGESWIHGLPEGEDVLATVACLRGLGANLQRSGRTARIRGAGLSSIATPHGSLDCANSGTTMRLLLGVLAGSSISATLDGDASLRRRPMARVVEPLKSMGARIESHDGHPPLLLTGSAVQGRRHVLPLPSAQVKSALLLAGLAARGPTTVVEPVPTRDHTERLLAAVGADLRVADGTVELRPSHRPLGAIELAVPGDFSSASFWMAAAALRPGWSITIAGVGLNPTRTAFLRILEAMGAAVAIEPTESEIEPVGTVRVAGRPLFAVTLGAEEVVAAIDEIPAVLAGAAQAEGLPASAGGAAVLGKRQHTVSGTSQ